MFSNHLAEVFRRIRLRRPRTWALQTRLLAVVVTLLIVVCAGIGAGTLLAMNRFLLQQLDRQVIDAGLRSTGFYDFGPPPFERYAGPGPLFLDGPGQSVDTVGAVIVNGRVTEAAVVAADGNRSQLSPTAFRQLADIKVGDPVRINLDGLGHYELVGVAASNGNTVVAGLPLAGVNNTLLTIFGFFSAVAAVALILAAAVGIWIIRRQFAPLSQVVHAAHQVAQLDLVRGEVNLPTPLVHVDPDTTHTEVGQLAAAFNRMLNRIAEALAVRHASETRVRQFVADASHELRTPLASIRGYTELARRRLSSSPTDLAHAIDRVDVESKRMSQLVEEMLLLARMDAGRPLDHEQVDLCQLAVDTVSDAYVAGPEHRWSVNVPDEPVMVIGDRVRLHQVLANLMSNARVHTPPGTRVNISLTHSGDGRVVLTVTDNGPGIPEHQQPEIFERFARGDSSRSRRAGSTGLGLAIVAALVKAHNGTVEVRSVPGETVFVVTLPAIPLTHPRQDLVQAH
ncbi:HAMP domain-containing histidine kinase [Mycolicibacterium wolinskyi]|uniref:histidine kinase n=1 Tax=Mycolicibacterium wolinskyi TaxID=59750 RepID=A0A1X2F920_9MYCO|nr:MULTISPECIES: HAMP domain-containing sensor histidine kinase [Mycolicibacterium]MCV7286315.1 HAMP domain-containing histidine kinase [Mycolicibacterium wolinskyi]MCV7293295.1 HAMP domain-containing histidine kinase [Mycolicibacterium goodii]ORX14940.1 histidine kinase [Mycolicibacterium wolinskyi]